ncbi:hypothetical protein [Nocardia farcinica]|uniref:hypothetical protein n=1 Tax=Nocardia farcinica TaxID=37329 RepID=UPI002454B4B7|nr:hypothetical protein [Nocardia farcinica]
MTTIPTSFFSAAGEFPMSVVTPAMAKALDTVDDSGAITGSAQTLNRLIKIGLAEDRRIRGVYLTNAGWDVLAALPLPAAPKGGWTGTGEHRTRTIEWVTGEQYKTKSNGSCGRYVNTTLAKAECVCGWSAIVGDRGTARFRAREHRNQSEQDLAA